jgi:hypothetical protein
MVIKVFFERIDNLAGANDIEHEDNADWANVTVRVKNTDTLDEYRGESFCNPLFFDKIS